MDCSSFSSSSVRVRGRAEEELARDIVTCYYGFDLGCVCIS